MSGPRRSGEPEVAVVGLGRSGVAATRLLLARQTAVYASDRAAGPELEQVAAALAKLGADVELGGHDLSRIRAAVEVVVSPGVPPDAEPLRAARAAGVPIRAEADLGLGALEGIPYVAVTGTNGKSTTTALAAHLLRTVGREAVAAGNIGLPLCEVALHDPKPAWLAIELSSFQLHDMPGIAPRAGILTNLSPDHLDRYPDLQSYYSDKRLFFRNAGPDACWILNGDDPASLGLAEGVAGRQRTFSVTHPAAGWLDRRKGLRLMLGDAELLERRLFPLLGDHNVANALAAALAVYSVTDADPAAIGQGLATFQSLPHRLQPVGEKGGVLWINDSKATNLASTEVALAAVERPYVLLLGGRHKGESYRRLAPALSRCRAVVAYGEAAPLIGADLGQDLRVIPAPSFEAAVATAGELAVSGDAVLLSPACSSYDMFRNYEERGLRFRELVEAL